MFKKTTCWIDLLYGILLIAIAIAAYYRKNSFISLCMGGGFGLIIIASAFLLFPKKKLGIYSSVIVTLILCGTFAVRYSMTHLTLPALLAVLSGGMLIFLLAQSTKWKSTKR